MKGQHGAATARQRAFLETVQALALELGHAPSRAAIAERLGITPAGARGQLQSLEAQGLLYDAPKVVRSGQWVLTKEALALLEQ